MVKVGGNYVAGASEYGQVRRLFKETVQSILLVLLLEMVGSGGELLVVLMLFLSNLVNRVGTEMVIGQTKYFGVWLTSLGSLMFVASYKIWN